VLNEKENVVRADTGNIVGRAERDAVEPFGEGNFCGLREGMSARVRGGDEEHSSLSRMSRLNEGSEEESRRKAGPTLALPRHLPRYLRLKMLQPTKHVRPRDPSDIGGWIEPFFSFRGICSSLSRVRVLPSLALAWVGTCDGRGRKERRIATASPDSGVEAVEKDRA
jgi:hypothetical protein